jgi:hypothetical protein
MECKLDRLTIEHLEEPTARPARYSFSRCPIRPLYGIGIMSQIVCKAKVKRMLSVPLMAIAKVIL